MLLYGVAGWVGDRSGKLVNGWWYIYIDIDIDTIILFTTFTELYNHTKHTFTQHNQIYIHDIIIHRKERYDEYMQQGE